MSLEEELKIALESNSSAQVKDAFNKIYNKYYKLVAFCIAQKIRSRADVEDLCDEVFISFFNRLGKTEMNNIKYYLTTSAKNIAISFLRRQKENAPLDENIVASNCFEDSIDDVLSVYSEIVSREDLEIIAEHAVYGTPLAEIARNLGQSKNTVKSKYRRATEKIKKAYGRKEH